MSLSQYLIAVGSALFTGAWLHEGSHYFVGWIGQTGPQMEFTAVVFPNGVRHCEIETMDSELIRLSGISIYTWIPVGLLALALFALSLTPIYLFLAGTPVGPCLDAVQIVLLGLLSNHEIESRSAHGLVLFTRRSP